MACVNMFSADHKGRYSGAAAPPPLSPRISFSNDFVLDAATGCPTVRYERAPPAAAAHPDFEFSVESNDMMTADELFFKGRLVPLKEHCAATRMQRMTLRDELVAGEVDDDDMAFLPASSSRLPGKASLRWKTLLGLRKLQPPAGNKHDKNQEKLPHQESEEEEDPAADSSAATCTVPPPIARISKKKEGRCRSASDPERQIAMGLFCDWRREGQEQGSSLDQNRALKKECSSPS